MTQRTACSALVPEEMRAPRAGAPLPAGDTVGDWIQFADEQTARLDQANADKLGYEVIERCEARDREVIDRVRRPWWKFW